MSLPTPDNPQNAPVWENYVVAQVVQASLGLIPRHALATGVEVEGAEVRLRFQLSEVSEQDALDMADILGEFQELVGGHVDAVVVHEVLDWRAISPHDGVRWVFLARERKS
ncbi:MAG: hypothetical protein GY788_26530 [bacterium]|nr:hypothetical protein [bacterium]